MQNKKVDANNIINATENRTQILLEYVQLHLFLQNDTNFFKQ